MFVPGKPFQPSVVFAGGQSLPEWSTFQGRLLASPTNTTLGWKGLPGTNTLAYYENPYNTAVKSFIVQAAKESALFGGIRIRWPMLNTLAYSNFQQRYFKPDETVWLF